MVSSAEGSSGVSAVATISGPDRESQTAGARRGPGGSAAGTARRSTLPWRPWRRRSPSVGGRRRRYAHPRGSGPGAAGPVSYTHLRAHETVLDLVCRLLLEKKK